MEDGRGQAEPAAGSGDGAHQRRGGVDRAAGAVADAAEAEIGLGSGGGAHGAAGPAPERVESGRIGGAQVQFADGVGGDGVDGAAAVDAPHVERGLGLGVRRGRHGVERGDGAGQQLNRVGAAVGAPGVPACGVDGDFVAVAGDEGGLDEVERVPFDGEERIELPGVVAQEAFDAPQVAAPLLAGVGGKQDVADAPRRSALEALRHAEQRGDAEAVISHAAAGEPSAAAGDGGGRVGEDGVEVGADEQPGAAGAAAADGDDVGQRVGLEPVPAADRGQPAFDVRGAVALGEGGGGDLRDGDRLVDDAWHNGR